MKISWIVFFLALTLLSACGSNVPGTVTEPSSSVPTTKTLPMEASPSSTSDAEVSPTAVLNAGALLPIPSDEQIALSSFFQPVTADGE